jgi:hypothetical protein
VAADPDGMFAVMLGFLDGPDPDLEAMLALLAD